MRSYLKVYFSFDEDTEALSDDEKGRLLLAMLRYAKDESTESLPGNEKFLFPVFKSQIDRDSDVYDTKVANGSKAKASGSKRNLAESSETERNLAKVSESERIEADLSETERNEAESSEIYKIEDKDKDKDKDKEKEKGNRAASRTIATTRFEEFWSAYPRHEAKQKALAAFLKINPDDELMHTMLESIEAWKKTEQWTENGGQFIPHPTTWLNGRRWEDEVPAAKAGGTKPARTIPAQQYSQRSYADADEDVDSIYESLGLR